MQRHSSRLTTRFSGGPARVEEYLGGDNGVFILVGGGGLDIFVEDALDLLHRYASTHGDQIGRVSRRLMAEPDSRAAIIADMRRLLKECP